MAQTFSLRDVNRKAAQFAAPEKEYQQIWTPSNTLVSPSSIRTDKVISAIIFRWHGRINTTLAFTPVPDALRYLLQEVRVLGTHAQFGQQTPIRLRAKTFNDLNVLYRLGAYVPNDVVAGTLGGAGSTVDADVMWFLPLWHPSLALQLAPFYSLKGPDWAGNLFIETDTGNETALGDVAGNTTFTAFGSATGNPTLFVSLVRPTLTVDLMNAMSPAISFRTYRSLDAVVQGPSGADLLLQNLNIGKKMADIVVQTGTLTAGLSAGQRSYSAFSDAIVTRSYISLDGKALQQPWSGFDQQEWSDWARQKGLLAGYKTHNFVIANNPDAAFDAQTLTAARRFEVDADITSAATAGCEVVQEEILGDPSFVVPK